MAAVDVWASAHDTPTSVCPDARLTDRAVWSPWGRSLSDRDQTWGQSGWHVGLRYGSLAELARRLERLVLPDYVAADEHSLRRGELRRLAIYAHGAPGALFVGGAPPAGAPTPPSAIALSTLASHRADLVRIGLLTSNARRSYIYLMGCVAGQGQDGSALLIALSRLWPGRFVVGFASIGYAAGGRMLRRGQACTEAGMRDTSSPFSLLPEQQERRYGPIWGDLERLPWADHGSPSAKVVIDGTIIRGAEL